MIYFSKSLKLIMLSLGTTLFSTYASAVGPASFSYDGVLTDSTGYAVELPSVTFTLRVSSPGVEGCILYEEQQTLNMTGSGGRFSLSLGSGTVNASTPRSLRSALSNAQSFSGLTCSSGANYAPASGDSRLLTLLFNDGSSTVTMSPSIRLGSSPYAMEADTIQGKLPSDFIQTNVATAAVSQANLESVFATTANVTQLQNLINGTQVISPSGSNSIVNKNYSDTTIAGKPVASSVMILSSGDVGKYLSWSGSDWTAAPAGVGGVSNVGLAFSSLFGVAGSPVTSSGTMTATLLPQPIATVFAAPLGASGPPIFRSLDSSDLPVLGVLQGGTGRTSNFTPNGIILADGSGSSLNSTICPAGQILQSTGSTWTCATSSAANAFTNGGNSFGGTVGFGNNQSYGINFITSAAIRASIGASGNFLVGFGTASTSALLEVKGHIANTGPSASVGSCGSGSSTAGNDSRGRITIGTGGVTTCTVIFASPYSVPPTCVATWSSTNAAISYSTGLSVSATTSVMTFGFSSDASGLNLNYICME